MKQLVCDTDVCIWFTTGVLFSARGDYVLVVLRFLRFYDLFVCYI